MQKISDEFLTGSFNKSRIKIPVMASQIKISKLETGKTIGACILTNSAESNSTTASICQNLIDGDHKNLSIEKYSVGQILKAEYKGSDNIFSKYFTVGDVIAHENVILVFFTINSFESIFIIFSTIKDC